MSHLSLFSYTDYSMQCVRLGHTANRANMWAHCVSADTVLPLYDVFQKTGAGCPPVVLYTQDRVMELKCLSF